MRTAVGEDAERRLAKEEAFYRDLHDGYRNHFARLGASEGTVGVAAADRGQRQARARRLRRALDVTVVRGLASASLEAMIAVAEARRRESAGRPAARCAGLTRCAASSSWPSSLLCLRPRRLAPRRSGSSTRAAGSPMGVGGS